MKTKRNGVTGIAVRNLFTVMVAFLLVFGFNACSNSGGGGGPSGDSGTGSKKDKNSKDSEEGGIYWNEELGRAYEVSDNVYNDEGVLMGKIFYDSFKDPEIMDYFTLYEDRNDTVGVDARYIIVALPDPENGYPRHTWTANGIAGGGSALTIEGTEAAIGTGKKNTDLIYRRDSNAPGSMSQSAAGFVRLELGGADWFLPSIKELEALYRSGLLLKLYTPPNNNTGYWSSTQVDKDFAKMASITDDGDFVEDNTYKRIVAFVYAVRAF